MCLIMLSFFSFLRTDHHHTSLFNKQKTHTSACVCNLKSMHKRKVERAREKLSRRSAVAHKLSSNHFLVCSSLSLAIMFCTVVQRERRRKGIKKNPAYVHSSSEKKEIVHSFIQPEVTICQHMHVQLTVD